MRRFLVLATTATALASGPAPDAATIVRRSVQLIEADWKRAPEYSYLERDVESKHDSAPTIKPYEVLMIDGSQYNELVAINDHPLSPAQKAQEEKKLRAEILKRGKESGPERRKRVAGYLKERAQDHAMLKEMVDAFTFVGEGEATVDGHECWVFNAEPKPGYVPKTRETRVLTGMKGKLWIDKRQNQWVKVEAEVIHPVRLFGFVATVDPGTRFFLQQAPVAKNLWLPTHFSVKVNASALGIFNEDSLDDETYLQYKPMPHVSDLEAQK